MSLPDKKYAKIISIRISPLNIKIELFFTSIYFNLTPNDLFINIFIIILIKNVKIRNK